MIRSLKQSIKDATAGSVWLRYSLLAPWRIAYSTASLVTHRTASGTLRGDNPEPLEDYARRIFRRYKSWLGIDRFSGTVAEVRPGDVTEISRLMVEDGCSAVHLVDRFRYGANGPTSPLIHHHRIAAEQFFQHKKGFDFIVSCAVMEHLYNPLAVLRSMAHALKPGGMMAHAVDCRDHNQFSDAFHDLAFLRIPPLLQFPLKIAGGLNRVRLSGYVQTAEELGLDYSVLIARLSGIPESIEPAVPYEDLPTDLISRSQANLAKIKPQLANPFRQMSDRDLMVSVFVLVAQRH